MKPASYYREMAAQSRAKSKAFLVKLEKEIERFAVNGKYRTDGIVYPTGIDRDYVEKALLDAGYEVSPICNGVVISWKREVKNERSNANLHTDKRKPGGEPPAEG